MATAYAGGIALPLTDAIALDPSDDGPLVVDRVGPVWQTLDDLLQLLPAVLRGGSSTLRDAWLQAWGQAVLGAQASVGFAFEAQASPRFADGLWLDAWGLLLSRPRVQGEGDADYRARLMSSPDLVSPSAIKAAVNATMAAAGLAAVIYNEPAVDQAYCGPATTTDAMIINSRQQAVGTLQTWFAFTQPQIPRSGVATPNQSVYAGKNLRMWANYSGLTGNTNIGAFSAPLGAGFWIIIQAPIGDDAYTPHSEPVSFSTASGARTTGLDSADFVQGKNSDYVGENVFTINQTVIQGAPTFTSLAYGYVPQAYDTIIDRLNSEVTRRRAAGVPWVVMIDYPVQYTR